VYHCVVLALALTVLLTAPVEVERVLAVVNGVPVLSSDAELAEVAELVPREAEESDLDYRRAVVTALVDLELRYQDLAAAGVVERTPVDLDAAWSGVVKRAGGADALKARLAASGFDEAVLRQLVRRAAVVEAYVARRFAPFIRPSRQEVEQLYRDEVVTRAQASGVAAPTLDAVRPTLESLLRERKLADEVGRWTDELAKRAEVVRYIR
jgi:hypothetical protein